MTGAGEILCALQHADSFFPGGAVSFSWGLEALAADGRIAGVEDVDQFAADMLERRWASCDRSFLTFAHHHADDFAALAEADALLEASTLMLEQRTGSQRCGAALLAVHAALGAPTALRYRARMHDGNAAGHLAIVQGMLMRGLGLSIMVAEIAAAHALLVGVLGAAIRLSLIGHLDAQRVLTRRRQSIVRIVSEPARTIRQWHAFTPGIDIAAMRHEVQSTRLFAN